MSSETAGRLNGQVTGKYDRGTDQSNFLAFVIGGLVIGVGLLAFLFYDHTNNTGPDVTTTGSTLPRIESPAAPVATPTSPASNPAR